MNFKAPLSVANINKTTKKQISKDTDNLNNTLSIALTDNCKYIFFSNILRILTKTIHILGLIKANQKIQKN